MRSFAFIFLLPSLAIQAQTNPLETLTVTGKRLTASKQSLAINTAVVEQQSLKIVNPVHINEALARVPGAIDLSSTNIRGNDIDTAPRHIGAAQFGWSSARGHRAEMEWVHMGAYYQDPENSVRYPGHDLLNARVIYSLNKRWQAAVRVNNLTNEDYAERADFAFSDDGYFVGEPRSVLLSISAEFGG